LTHRVRWSRYVFGAALLKRVGYKY